MSTIPNMAPSLITLLAEADATHGALTVNRSLLRQGSPAGGARQCRLTGGAQVPAVDGYWGGGGSVP